MATQEFILNLGNTIAGGQLNDLESAASIFEQLVCSAPITIITLHPLHIYDLRVTHFDQLCYRTMHRISMSRLHSANLHPRMHAQRRKLS